MALTYEEIFDQLLDFTEGMAKSGVTTFDLANVMSRFVVKLSYDTAPNMQHATALLLTAITDRMEHDIVGSADDD
jgi:hypothetical protein|tara:strand:- start:172 stop:396 length:225 start_codon:yes stop_codon:yes gene_type:complete